MILKKKTPIWMVALFALVFGMMGIFIGSDLGKSDKDNNPPQPENPSPAPAAAQVAMTRGGFEKRFLHTQKATEEGFWNAGVEGQTMEDIIFVNLAEAARSKKLSLSRLGTYTTYIGNNNWQIMVLLKFSDLSGNKAVLCPRWTTMETRWIPWGSAKVILDGTLLQDIRKDGLAAVRKVE